MSKSGVDDDDFTFNLELGDIITILAPNNDLIDNRIYYIDYIDFEKINIIDVKSREKTTLTIEAGSLDDKTIEEIHILSRSDEKGYILQNNLQLGKWVDIKFGGDEPIIITAEITNIENDMLEMKTLRDNNTIYIDFAYKGLPEKLNIEYIRLRDTPKSVLKPKELEETVEPEMVGSLVDPTNDDESLQRNLEQELILGENFKFGESFDDIPYVIQVDDDKKRYNLDEQLVDLLEDILALIPVSQRTNNITNNIKHEVNRFKELREKFSELKNTTLHIREKEFDRPLIGDIMKGSNIPKWIVPVVKNKKIIDKHVFCSGLKKDECSELLEKMEREEPDKFNTIDMKAVSLTEYLKHMNDAINNYYSNTNQVVNNYYEFIRRLHEVNKPFDIDTYDDDILDLIDSNKQILALSDSNSNNFNMPIYSKTGLVQSQFINETFLSELHFVKTNYTTNKSSKDLINKADQLPLLGLLTLPINYIEYLNTNINHSSILSKSIHNLSFMSQLDAINNEELVNNVVEPSKEMLSVKKNTKDFHSLLINHRLNNSEEIQNKLEYFLKRVIPNTNNIISNIASINRNITTVDDYIKKLEIFGYSQDNLTEKNANKISSIINKNIENYKSDLQKNIASVKQISQMKYNESYSTKEIVNLLNKALQGSISTILDTYNLQDIASLENSEIINRINKIDGGKLFSTIISLKNINLYVEKSLDDTMADYEKTIQDFNQGIKSDEEKPSRIEKNKKCQTYKIAKKYKSMNDLLSDNNKEIYYDLQYDDTPYIIKNDYKELQTLTEEEGVLFLKQKLTENLGFSEAKSNEYSLNIISGKKRVSDGEFAIVDSFDDRDLLERKYFVRRENAWVEEKIDDEDVFVNNNKTLCNIQPGCDVVNDNECISVESSKNMKKTEFVNDMVKDFKAGLSISREELEAALNVDYGYQFNIITRLNEINEVNKSKQERYHKSLAMLAEDVAPILSPYNDLFDLILNQSDFVKRQGDIIKFCDEYTRNPLSDEDVFWLYCKITDVKLVPSFFKDLAMAFHSGNYNAELYKVCRDRGVLSDDGDKWIDKYSGRKIKDVEYSTDEGYEQSGFRAITREILDRDAKDEVYDIVEEIDDKEKEKEVNSTKRMVKNIIKTLNENMGTSLDEKQIMLLLNEKLGVILEQVPNKGSQEEIQNNRNRIILFSTLCFFFIGIQTAIPSIITTKTFPGCTSSFEGYPLHGTSDMSGFNYLCCVTMGLKSSIAPWNVLKKIKKQETLQTNLKKIMNTIVLEDNPPVQNLLQLKRQHLLTKQPEEDKMMLIYNIKNWTTFLPPLKRIKYETVSNLGSTFKGDLDRSIKANKKHIFKIDVIRSKLFYISLSIQKEITDVIQKNKPLLINSKNEPFISNACCNDEGKFNTLNYFIENADKIKTYNKNLNELTDLLKTYESMRKPQIFFDNIHITKGYIETELEKKSEFNDEIIYSSFIKFCKYNTHTKIPIYLEGLCRNKPEEYKNTMELSEKIRLLKTNGYSYDVESFKELLSIINKRNEIKITNLDYLEYDIKANLETTIDLLDDVEYSDDFDNFNQKYKIFLKHLRNNIQDKKKDTLNKYLLGINYDIRKVILSSLKSMVSKSEYNMIENFLENYEDKINHIDENTYIIKIKNIIKNISLIYPVIILNKTICSTSNISNHWKLSERHYSDITKIINSQNVLKKCFNNSEIDNIMVEMTKITKYILLLIDVLPNLNNDFISNEDLMLVYKYIFYQLLELIISYRKTTIGEISVPPISPRKDKQLVDSFLESEELDELEPLQKTQEEIQRIKSTIVSTFLTLTIEDIDEVNIAYNEIIKKVNRSKEREKNEIVDSRREMSVDERKTDTLKQSLGLEEWAKGAGAIYTKERYDMEMGKIDLEEQRINDEIEREEYSMGLMANDDDYEDGMDGDEQYY
tara:strand:+ start:1619 stop:7363 length:5745 start_codon:yes stop_codon:yes gene_type:complete